jgi:hypothetical protein
LSLYKNPENLNRCLNLTPRTISRAIYLLKVSLKKGNGSQSLRKIVSVSGAVSLLKSQTFGTAVQHGVNFLAIFVP